ncbi:toxin-antitoxin system TumE family protein [Natronolimnobius baerhuensis]|uniref:Uncharacterized protein n=1 Tax=Natronolimnobius baerhuensis TaxID=253108 RepID=A0A202ECS1_9EURY|nr:DUF6516 family protein [Natronolimnobius baerhuensis]OVE86034.1 hypothetical protein B2G88_04355 [Natronolimnobius baerhuensis]
MTGREDDEAVAVIDVTKDFGETFAEIRAWNVPSSDRYPDGVKYSMQYGTTDGETIIRYDNFPDHPDAAQHHKHLSNGDVEDIEFTGLEPLYDRFKQEVRTHGEHW